MAILSAPKIMSMIRTAAGMIMAAMGMITAATSMAMLMATITPIRTA